VKPPRRRRILKAVLLLVVVALGVLALLVVWQWTFLSRMLTYPDNPVTDAAWYQPREVVRGSPGEPLPAAARPRIRADALAQAADYAERKNSSALLVVHDGEVVAEHYWRGQSADSPTNSMSMAKTVVGLLVGVAIEEGHIASVDEPASKYLTEWAGDGRRRITIRQLLQMASGLGGAEHNDDPFSPIGRMYLGTDALSVVAETPLAFEPGSRFEYNSINTQALSVVLERASGRRYADYLSAKLWRPLGASDASVWLDRPGGNAKTFCCLFATARDWARVGLLIVNGGRVGDRQVVPASWVKEMLTPSPQEQDYGYHIWLGRQGSRKEDHDEEFLADDVAYIDGKFKQRVYLIPSRRLVIVRVGEQARAWDDAYLPNAVVRGLAAGR
jgi:CubicO group peptidase (beta-lactamase class C family)